MSSKGLISSSTSTFEDAVNQLFGLYVVGLLSSLAALAAYFVLKKTGACFGIFDSDRGEALGREASHHGYLLLALALTFPKFLTIMAPLLLFPNNPDMLLELLRYVATQGKVLAVLTSFGSAYMFYGITLAILTCIIKWSVIGRVDKVISSQYSPRLWFLHALLRFTHEKFMNLLQGTDALCLYLRILGANVGHRVSIRKTNALIDPDLLEIGDDCHLGDFCKIITTEHFPGKRRNREFSRNTERMYDFCDGFWMSLYTHITFPCS